LNLAEDQTISFTSPSGSIVTYERTSKASLKNGGSYGEEWHGTAGYRAANIISRTENDGNVIYTASFDIPDHVCHLKYVGEQDISCRHVSTFPPLAPEINVESLSNTEEKIHDKKNNIFEQIISTLGIMVLWTKKAECAQSYESEGCKVNNNTKEGNDGSR